MNCKMIRPPEPLRKACLLVVLFLAGPLKTVNRMAFPAKIYSYHIASV
jgi:hypothetical protein